MYTHEEKKVIDEAIAIIESKINDGLVISSPSDLKNYVRLNIATSECELFAVIFLSNIHRVISFEIMFRGTINQASVYTREVVKEALKHNAAAVIFSHNHPSGSHFPSAADDQITDRLKDALSFVDIKVIDHLIVSCNGSYSYAEEGKL